MVEVKKLRITSQTSLFPGNFFIQLHFFDAGALPRIAAFID
jgi:hypothetical protein